MTDLAAQQAMHAILDMIVAFDDDATAEENDIATRTAFARLNDIDAITATRDDETEVTTLNVTPLLTAVGVTVDTLIRQIANEREQDRLTILNVVRETLDSVLKPD